MDCSKNFNVATKCIYPIPTILLSTKILPKSKYRPETPTFIKDLLRKCKEKKPETPPGTMKHRKVQTIYRESEAQTYPYEVDVYEPFDPELEILTLGYLSWDNGLPAGLHEVEMIERARQRRAWMKNIPDPITQDAIDYRSCIIEMIEINEFAFREEEIEFINMMRMELAEELLNKKMRFDRGKLLLRIAKITIQKKKERQIKLNKCRKQHNRTIRKLINQRNKESKRYYTWNVVKAHADKTSEWYGPLAMFGENPKRFHEEIESSSRYEYVFKYVNVLNQRMNDVPEICQALFDYERLAIPKEYNKRLCKRETRWTDEFLKTFYEELKALRMKEQKKPLRLRQLIPIPSPRVETPTVEALPEWEENLYQCCVFLQKVIRGRSMQVIMFEGRVMCQELINELKSTHVLQKSQEDLKAVERKRIYNVQRDIEIQEKYERRKEEMLASMEGMSIGDMLDFLANELLRLQDERATHALALLADRERHRREATEAGRRQKEEKRRREHDEMFKQILKVHQNSVDLFLEDVVKESKMWLSEREAREYICNTAKKIDQAAYHAQLRAQDIEEEEIVGDLIHNFALPEVQKVLVRQRVKDKQRNYLKTAHDIVYGEIESLCQGERSASQRLVSIPRQVTMVKKMQNWDDLTTLKLKRSFISDSSSVTSSVLTRDSSDTASSHGTVPIKDILVVGHDTPTNQSKAVLNKWH